MEINHDSAEKIGQVIGEDNIVTNCISEYQCEDKANMALTLGALININPEMHRAVCERVYRAFNRLILVCEYYPPLMSTPYCEPVDMLFKRDFEVEMLEMYSDLKLLDFRFIDRRDSAFPQVDITLFLMPKTG